MITRQYYMYGVVVSHKWYDNWKNEETIDIETLISKGETTADDISCVFSGRDGKFIIIGKILKTFNDDKPVVVQELSRISEREIEDSIKKNFDLSDNFRYYFVKTYK